MSDKFIAHFRHSDGTAQLLSEHLKSVSLLAADFSSKIGMSAFGELAGLLHDTGKYLPLFQHYIKSSAGLIPPESPCYTDPVKYKGRIDHSTAGGLYIWKYGESCVDRSIAKIIALCVLSHHGGLLNLLNPDGTDTFTVRLENKLDDDTCLQIFSSIEPDILKRIEKLIPMLADQFTAKWSSIRHKNGNNITLYFHAGLLIRFLFSSLIDADRTDTARFEKDENDSGSDEFSWDEQIQKLDRRLSAFSCKNRVDKIRKTVSESCLNFAHRKKGLFQLTVPTGGGKTLASLRFALNHAAHHKMKRIIYIIPYTSIIDQNAAEIRKILEDREELSGRIVLEHHSNITSDNEEELKRTKCLTENWNSPVIFTTMVQFLETLFSHGTRGVRRMHNLADSVMIFDEIQTLPVKTVHMFNNAINFFVEQCGSSAVFCTATQPLLDKVDQELGSAKLSPNHRIMADTESLFSGLKRTEVIDNRKVGGWETEEIFEFISKRTEETDSLLIIVNTKKQAKELFGKVREQLPHKSYHLSTSMCPEHRMTILSNIKEHLSPEKPQKVICVSTQLIEAGVDVDFGTVVRYLAGLDSIAQAAGRCNRNGLRESGKVFIVNPANEDLSFLPDIRIARQNCERVLHEYTQTPEKFGYDILSPKLMENYYTYYFYSRSSEMAYPLATEAAGHKDSLVELLSRNRGSLLNYTDNREMFPPPHQAFKTAGELFKVIEAPTHGIIVPYGDKGKEIIGKLFGSCEAEELHSLLKKAQRYSVNIFDYELQNLRKKNALREAFEGSSVFCLDERHYDPDFGVTAEPSAGVELLNI